MTGQGDGKQADKPQTSTQHSEGAQPLAVEVSTLLLHAWL